MKTDIQAMASKIRMDLSNKQSGGEGQASQGLEDEIQATRVFDPHTNTLDFGKRKVTEMKTCKRIQVPGPCLKEAKLQTLVNQLEDIVEKAEEDEKQMKVGRTGNSFPTAGCSSPVLTESQQKGKTKLLGRQKAG